MLLVRLMLWLLLFILYMSSLWITADSAALTKMKKVMINSAVFVMDVLFGFTSIFVIIAISFFVVVFLFGVIFFQIFFIPFENLFIKFWIIRRRIMMELKSLALLNLLLFCVFCFSWDWSNLFLFFVFWFSFFVFSVF